jgi:hypothetical protein
MTIGWGLGEWSDMAWGTGADYPYDPTVFLAAEGPLRLYAARSGALAAHSVVGRLAAPMTGAGRLRSYAATGTIRS